MPEKFLKPYDPATTEPRIYAEWESSGYFNPDNLPADGKPYTIVMPPPNANGDLHAGHALFITLEDILIRFKRMRGFRALWIPGADHAGFETQVVYEKKLEKEGRSRFGMEPKQLYDEILAFTLENKRNMERQIRELGASCDWSREKFTLDPVVVEEVQKTFEKMFADGLIYRGKRTINWCPKHQTSLSDVETTWVDQNDSFYYLKYGPFVIGTVRPETKFGDKYLVVNPKDERYKTFSHGQHIDLEWINGPITATVIHDPNHDMEFGTGAMTITPWHDQHDFELAKTFGLPFEQVIDWRGKLLPIAGEFVGMKITDARQQIVDKLAAKGLIDRIDERYVHATKHCYKCDTLIEPQVKDQWFVKMAPLAEQAIKVVNRGDVRFVPDNYEKIFRYWMENALDWNISRQIVWGIPIPAWFRNRDTDEDIVVSRERPAGEGWEADTDTFDTWFSSGQWPLVVTGFPNGRDFSAYYPTDVMETGHDLIFRWVPRMIIFGLYLAKKAPFHTVYLHGLVNDAQGKKMSKSKGNVISPFDLTSKYGTDALRMALVVGNTPGTDLALREDKVKGYKHFANKLWNIARFVLASANEQKNGDKTWASAPERAHFSAHECELLDACDALTKDVTKDIEEYRIYMAAEKLYHYAWHELADKILEESKPIFAGADPAARASRARLLVILLDRTLRLLHPFMPFVTEEIYQSMPTKDSKFLMVARWPLLR